MTKKLVPPRLPKRRLTIDTDLVEKDSLRDLATQNPPTKRAKCEDQIPLDLKESASDASSVSASEETIDHGAYEPRISTSVSSCITPTSRDSPVYSESVSLASSFTNPVYIPSVEQSTIKTPSSLKSSIAPSSLAVCASVRLDKNTLVVNSNASSLVTPSHALLEGSSTVTDRDQVAEVIDDTGKSDTSGASDATVLDTGFIDLDQEPLLFWVNKNGEQVFSQEFLDMFNPVGAPQRDDTDSDDVNYTASPCSSIVADSIRPAYYDDTLSYSTDHPVSPKALGDNNISPSLRPQFTDSYPGFILPRIEEAGRAYHWVHEHHPIHSNRTYLEDDNTPHSPVHTPGQQSQAVPSAASGSHANDGHHHIPTVCHHESEQSIQATNGPMPPQAKNRTYDGIISFSKESIQPITNKGHPLFHQPPPHGVASINWRAVSSVTSSAGTPYMRCLSTAVTTSAPEHGIQTSLHVGDTPKCADDKGTKVAAAQPTTAPVEIPWHSIEDKTPVIKFKTKQDLNEALRNRYKQALRQTAPDLARFEGLRSANGPSVTNGVEFRLSKHFGELRWLPVTPHMEEWQRAADKKIFLENQGCHIHKNDELHACRASDCTVDVSLGTAVAHFAHAHGGQFLDENQGCLFCGMYFGGGAPSNHLAQCDGLAPSTKWSCSRCGQFFVREEALKRHWENDTHYRGATMGRTPYGFRATVAGWANRTDNPRRVPQRNETQGVKGALKKKKKD